MAIIRPKAALLFVGCSSMPINLKVESTYHFPPKGAVSRSVIELSKLAGRQRSQARIGATLIVITTPRRDGCASLS